MGVAGATLSWSIPLGTTERKLGIPTGDLFFPSWQKPLGWFWGEGLADLQPGSGSPGGAQGSPQLLVPISRVPRCLVGSVPTSRQAAAAPPQSWAVAELLIPHLFFPQGDGGHEGDEGVPGGAGRRVSGAAVPTEGGRERGAAPWRGSQLSGGSESLEGGSWRDEGWLDEFGITGDSFLCGAQGKRGKMGQQPPRGPRGHKVGGFVRLPCSPGSLGVLPPA